VCVCACDVWLVCGVSEGEWVRSSTLIGGDWKNPVRK
jgi:hypothetical protein